MATVSVAEVKADAGVSPGRARLVIWASSLGSVFEWYDFFVYGTLAALLGGLFFPSDNPTAALLKSLATFGAGFGVRPLGAIVFGRLGDRIGRKRTFLVTIALMGGATVAVGLLPTYASAGVWAPVLLVICRLAQGLALGGEFGGAAIYVAEHAPPGKRGLHTSWIQVSITGGFLLSIGVVLGTQAVLGKANWLAWGWRVPFLISIVMLGISLWVRLQLHESPVFAAMKAAGGCAKSPLRESFATAPNRRAMFVAMIGIAAGLTVIFYTSEFYTLYFLQGAMQVDETQARILVGLPLLAMAPFVVGFGWLSDKIGRRPITIAGYALTLVLLFPLYHQIARGANPALAGASPRAPVVVTGQTCAFDVFAAKGQATPCARVLDYLAKHGVSYTKRSGPGLEVRMGGEALAATDAASLGAALARAGYPAKADPGAMDRWRIMAAIFGLGVLTASTIGAAAAVLVELFPARIRYTSMSLPYHLATGYFGGFLPFVTQYVVAKTGDAFAGLWYTIAVVAAALVVTIVGLPETRGRDVRR